MIKAGDKVGRLTVIRCVGVKKYRRQWECRCDCGKITVVREDSLTSRQTKSCGCLMKEWQHSSEHSGGKTHGLSDTRIYRIWSGMKSRCYCETTTGYSDYGGRGITVCNEWKNDFMAFYKWSMEHGYAENLTIDRIDVNGNYDPSNCRWATNSEQRKNQRKKTITYKGETKTLKQWSLITGISYTVLLYRLTKGWSVDAIITTPALCGNNMHQEELGLEEK